MPGLSDLLHEWRDFFVAVGAAAAALIGAMFVVASIGMGFFNRSHSQAIGSFLTPTVIHFSAVLVLCLLTMVPTLDWTLYAAAIAVIGLLGIGYSIFVAVDVTRRRELVLVDHFWYGAAPVAAYLAILGVGVLTFYRLNYATELLALAVVVQMIGGIRNSWDMIVFLITQDRNHNDAT